MTLHTAVRHATASDVVLETRFLVSRCLEDKNESLGLGLEHLILALILVLKKVLITFTVLELDHCDLQTFTVGRMLLLQVFTVLDGMV